ncbi:hypothetical protein [Mesorhizobium sp. M7A.F.Ca.US.008.03.1.1]|uniref:hypothetical protein n=1 Tax=Mesorhizobium sp. M7A.F.Ca.US.008.03.1.1 TaxID=2496742 RepID=UPI000FCB7412|nr:hypothetical protein [Mesorhizobium sp. M7A.F.Ca.US.008.03.1.1]RUW63510.1 hypothetical protein EOA16_05205 [Mesorhizobium sp. M7A.F.Ca.US.008.03.1.1]
MLQNPDARQKFIVFLQGQFGISAQEADTMLEHRANSFVGIFTPFDRTFRQRFSKANVERLLREINGETDGGTIKPLEFEGARARLRLAHR